MKTTAKKGKIIKTELITSQDRRPQISELRTWSKTSRIENKRSKRKRGKNLERKLGEKNNCSKEINKGKGSKILSENKLRLRRSDFYASDVMKKL